MLKTLELCSLVLKSIWESKRENMLMDSRLREYFHINIDVEKEVNSIKFSPQSFISYFGFFVGLVNSS